MKRFLTAILILFAAATTVRVVVAEILFPGGGETRKEALSVPEKGRFLGIYYFLMGKTRCSTCLTMEAFSREAVETRLGGEKERGRVGFAVADTESPPFRHYKEEFRLPSTSLVLALYEDGELLRFKNLNRIWRLVRRKKEFLDYVEREARDLLGEGR